MTTTHEPVVAGRTATIDEHPVWDELAHLGLAGDGQRATGYDGITTLALAVQATARLLIQDTLFLARCGRRLP